MGTGNTQDRPGPRPVDTGRPCFGAGNIAAISASKFVNNQFSCAINNNNRAYCWGGNALGQLGAGLSAAMRDHPRPLNTTARGLQPTNVAQLSTGDTHGCVLNIFGRP